MKMRMNKKRRLIRILNRAAKLRDKRELHYDACDMIYCALIDSSDDNLGNAEWELGLPVLTRTDGTLDQSRSDLHQDLAYFREQYMMWRRAEKSAALGYVPADFPASLDKTDVTT